MLRSARCITASHLHNFEKETRDLNKHCVITSDNLQAFFIYILFLNKVNIQRKFNFICLNNFVLNHVGLKSQN